MADRTEKLLQQLDPFRTQSEPRAVPRRRGGRPEPAYAPFSRAELLARLKTFSSNSWTYISAIRVTSPLLWARCGWSAVSATSVVCNLCKTVCEYDDAVRKYKVEDNAAKVIRTSHLDTCPWRKQGCADALYSLSLSLNLEHSLQAFRDRMQGLDGHVADDAEVASVGCDDIGNARATLAATGWEWDDGATCVVCKQCFAKFKGSPLDHEDYCAWMREGGWKLLVAIIRSRMELKSKETGDDERKQRIERLKSTYVYRRKHN